MFDMGRPSPDMRTDNPAKNTVDGLAAAVRSNDTLLSRADIEGLLEGRFRIWVENNQSEITRETHEVTHLNAVEHIFALLGVEKYREYLLSRTLPTALGDIASRYDDKLILSKEEN
jgi:hypothetical protein